MKLLRLVVGWLCLFIMLVACNPAPVDSTFMVKVTVDPGLSEVFSSQGRLFLFVDTQSDDKLYTRTWPNLSNEIYAFNVSDWTIGETISLDGSQKLISTTEADLMDLESGTYYMQLLWDQDENESRVNVPGNLISKVQEVQIKKGATIELSLKDKIPERILTDRAEVVEVSMKSKLLSDWWGKSVEVKAAVLLPLGYLQNTEKKYPILYNVAGYGGRYNRVNRYIDSDFGNWWLSGEAPEMINVFLDGEGPFGDCYQLDSENNGPYGQMLTTELIPFIEKEYRAIGTSETRFVDGCSTGGWVSLALQIFYPDVFNGCYSFSADAVDFEHFQLVNIYEDQNAFVNEHGLLRPVAREVNGEPRIALKDFIQYENVLGYNDEYITSGGQFGAFTALYSSKGKDGYPEALFDPVSGDMNHTVLEQWKKYDLKRILEENWNTLGPKLQGKIWIWMGDMDNFYLNPAMRSLDHFLKNTTNPTSDAVVNFTPMAGHCSEFDHRKVNEMIAEKLGL